MEKLKERKVHEGHWVQNLYCTVCQRPLTQSECFDMGFNWALSEMENKRTIQELDVEKVKDFLSKNDVAELVNDFGLSQLAQSIHDTFGQPRLDVDMEFICEKVHKAYCQWRIDTGKEEYWTKGDYSKLNEETKEADRYIVRAVLKVICEQKEGE